MTQTSANVCGLEKDLVPEGAAAVIAYFASCAVHDLASIKAAQRIYYANSEDPTAQACVIAHVAQSLGRIVDTNPDSVPRIAVWVCKEGGEHAENSTIVNALGAASTAFGKLLATVPEKALNLALWAEGNLPDTARPMIEYVLTQGAESLHPDGRSPLAQQVRARRQQIPPCPFAS